MDTLAVELIVDDQKANVKLDNFGQKIRLVSNDINRLGGDSRFAGKMTTDLDALSKRAEATYQSFRQIGNARLDSGNVGLLTREILTAQTKSRQLSADIVNIRRELANPQRGSSIAFLTTELKAAERELDKLSRKLSAVRQSNGGGNFDGFGGAFGGRVLPSAFSGGSTGAILGGIAGGATLAGINLAAGAVGTLTDQVFDLGVESIKLAGNVEETTNSIAVFAGSTGRARAELDALDKVALDTPGLRLEAAEKGYQRLRALNFEAGLSRDLIKGLGTQRVLSGATSDAVDRVITNLIQLKTGAGTAADVRQTVGQLPTLLPIFQKAFGTQDFGDINRIFKTDPQALKKFTDELAKAESAQVGLNVSVEKGKDALVQAGRIFGEPFLQPLTRDVQDLTKYLRDNESTVRQWGQATADALRGATEAYYGLKGTKNSPAQSIPAFVPLTILEANPLISIPTALSNFGKQLREQEEAEKRLKAAQVSFTDQPNGQFALDPLTNTLKLVSEIVENTPSLNDRLRAEEADEAANKLKRTLADIAEFSVKSALDDVSQNLEVQKAIAVRDAKGDSLKLAEETAALEIAALREQMALNDRMLAVKTQNLSPEDAAAGKGLLLAQEASAARARLDNQILLTQINLQKQQNEEIEKATNKVKELEKQYLSTFSNIFQKTGSDNPIFTAFNEGDKALKELRENLRGLPPEVQAVALAVQEKLNLKARLEAGLGNQLSILDLQQSAANFRNPFEEAKQRKDQDVFLADFFRRNPNFAFLNNIAPVRDVKDLPPDVRAKILKDFAPSGLVETSQDRLNRNLDEKFDAIYKPRQSALEQSVADKLFIGLTAGANALDLTRENRFRAAEAREREAVRQERFQTESVELQRRQLEAQKQIAENTKRQMEKAEKGGSTAVDITVKDNTAGGVSALRRGATARDTEDAYYDPDLNFTTGGGFTNR